MGIIQDLIREGVVKCWIDARSGHLNDLSENGNDGTPSVGTRWEGHALRFNAVTDEVTVAADASLSLTTGTLITLGRFRSQTSSEYLIGHLAGVTGYYLFMDATRLRFGADAGAWSIVTSLPSSRCIGITFESGQIPIGYVDGLSIGNFNGVATVTAAATVTTFGNTINVGQTLSPYESGMIISRISTAAEMAQLYDELANLTYPTKFYSYTKRTQAVERNEPGIIAGWHMRPAGGVIPDIVGASDGAIVGAPINEQGILGDRLLFDGVDDYINAGNVGTIKAVAFWTKPTTNTEDFLDLDGGTHTVEVAAGVVTATGWAAPTIFVDGVATTALLAGLRQRIVVSTATAFAANAVTLATETIFLEGTMGDVEFFSTEKDVGWALQDYLLGAKAIQLRSDWAYQVSPAAEGGILNQIIGTRGSILRAGDTGFRGFIEVEEVNGRLCKVIRCSTAGLLYIPMELAFDASPTECGFGTWDLWAYKADGSVLDMNLISTLSTGITTGYGFTWAADESVVVIEYGIGNVIAGGTASHSTWHRFRLTRASDGDFVAYIDDVTFGNGNDLTTTTADYILFDMDAGDRICLGSINGDEALMKFLGVVAP